MRHIFCAFSVSTELFMPMSLAAVNYLQEFSSGRQWANATQQLGAFLYQTFTEDDFDAFNRYSLFWSAERFF
jgi:hypothetical protein